MKLLKDDLKKMIEIMKEAMKNTKIQSITK